jgi:3-hydroxybutyrate dehydrogenase
MKANGWGRVINIASDHGAVARGQKAAYLAADHGLLGLIKVIAGELANHDMTCTAMCLGWMLRRWWKHSLPRAGNDGCNVDEAMRRVPADKQRMAQFPTPQGIAATAVFF